MGIIIPVATEYPLDILITEGASVVRQSRSAPHLPEAPRDIPAVAGAVCPRHILPVCSAWLQPFGAAGVFRARDTPACHWVGPRCGGSQKGHGGNFRVFQVEPKATRDLGGWRAWDAPAQSWEIAHPAPELRSPSKEFIPAPPPDIKILKERKNWNQEHGLPFMWNAGNGEI